MTEQKNPDFVADDDNVVDDYSEYEGDEDYFEEEVDEYDEYEEYDELDEYYEAPRTSKPKPKRESEDLLPGVVIRARGHHYDVEVIDKANTAPEQVGKVRMCEVRGRLLQERNVDTLVAVGDRVWIVPDGKRRGRIEQIEERSSVLSRQHPGISIPAEDVILANPDKVLVVFAVSQPEPHLRMLDRFLVIAEANELPAVICVNKIDLSGIEAAKTIFRPYEEIGYQVVYASAVNGVGMDELKSVLRDSITVFSGPSGVGKSSLLNSIHPDLDIHVGELRDVLDKGRHTTRAARMYSLPIGTNTFVADTPGIRELGLYDIDPQDLGFYFLEFVPHIHDCHYPNCTHDHEPNCAVRAAVTQGKITRARYESYLRLLQGEDAASEADRQ